MVIECDSIASMGENTIPEIILGLVFKGCSKEKMFFIVTTILK